MILTIIIFLLTISFLVFIHEGGHFLVAKWTRVWVHQFAIGIGPAIWRWRRRETEYSLRLFPIGGYVRMAGDEEPAAGKKATEGEEPAESAVEVPPDRLFMAKSPWQRMAIIFAGPLMNVLGAVLIIILLVALVGVPFVQIAGFSDHSPAASVMQPGDVILAINGQEIYSTQQVSRLIANSQGRPLDLLITRGEQGKNIHVTVQPYWDNSQGRYLIGVSFNGILLNQIGNLPSGSPLYQQGLRVNDVIVSVNKQPVRDWYEFTNDLRAALAGGARPATLEIIQSGGQRVQQALDLSGTPADLSAWLQGVQPLVLPIYGSTNVVQEIDHRSFLAQEGIEKGDRLVAINGEPVYDFINLIYLTASPGRATGGSHSNWSVPAANERSGLNSRAKPGQR
jgi:membrane-associated protease RseP (regulator of RpoE activity)